MNGVAGSTIEERIEALQAFVLEHVHDSKNFHLPFFSMELPWFLTADEMQLILAGMLLMLLFGVLYRKRAEAPGRLTNFLEVMVLFVRDEISIRFLGEEDGRRMAPLFCSLFFFILAVNLIGLLPGLPFATANINVTGAMAAVSLVLMFYCGIRKTGPWGFVKGFAPPGVPWPVLILLVPVEVAGMFVRSFALCIRLFANILAGHMALLFILGMIFVLGLCACPFLALGVMLFLLEIGVSFLQAYIFTLLSAIFIGQRMQPEH